ADGPGGDPFDLPGPGGDQFDQLEPLPDPADLTDEQQAIHDEIMETATEQGAPASVLEALETLDPERFAIAQDYLGYDPYARSTALSTLFFDQPAGDFLYGHEAEAPPADPGPAPVDPVDPPVTPVDGDPVDPPMPPVIGDP